MRSGPSSDGQVQLHYRDLAELLPNIVVYILDRDLHVVFAGGSLMAQRDFAAANLPASGMAGAVREGANYAAVCRAAAAEGRKEAQQWLDGMRAVLAGKPRLGGIGLVKALRKSGLHIPTILLSGHAAGEEHTGLQEAAVQAWLDKPPISWRLAEEIAKALGRE